MRRSAAARRFVRFVPAYWPRSAGEHAPLQTRIPRRTRIIRENSPLFGGPAPARCAAASLPASGKAATAGGRTRIIRVTNEKSLPFGGPAPARCAAASSPGSEEGGDYWRAAAAATGGAGAKGVGTAGRAGGRSSGAVRKTCRAEGPVREERERAAGRQDGGRDEGQGSAGP